MAALGAQAGAGVLTLGAGGAGEFLHAALTPAPRHRLLPEAAPEAMARLLSGAMRLLIRSASSQGSPGKTLASSPGRYDESDCGLEPRPSRKRRRARATHETAELGRAYAAARAGAVARRPRDQQWAQRWVVSRFPDLARDTKALDSMLRCCRRAAAKLHQASSQGRQGRAARGAGRSGVCTRQVPPSQRKRSFGGGRRRKAPAVGEELWTWFVDTVDQVKGRLPSFLLLDQARLIADDLKRHHQEQIDNGIVPLGTKLCVPAIGGSWLRSWRHFYGISWRCVNLRFKCPRQVLLRRLAIFWENVLRVRALHAALVVAGFEPSGGRLVVEGFDQKPLWFTASSQEKTLYYRGSRKVCVKENMPMTRARFTAMTRCRWPQPPRDGKALAILFKAAGGGARIRENLRVPDGALLQFQEKGSYRLADVHEYLEWIIDRSRIAGDGDEPDSPPPAASHGDGQVPQSASSQVEQPVPSRVPQPHPASSQPDALGPNDCGQADSSQGAQPASSQTPAGFKPSTRVIYLLDWFKPHLDTSLDDLVHAHGHAILRIGGHLTGLVQVEDTHAHGPYTKAYKKRETKDAFAQLTVNPGRVPCTSRQTVMDRAWDSWADVDHKSCSAGFVSNGICNKLDGSDDHKLTSDVQPFWFQLDMPARRKRILADIQERVASRRLTRFEQYTELLADYDEHPGLPEGAEAIGGRADDSDNDGEDDGSDDEQDDEGEGGENDDGDDPEGGEPPVGEDGAGFEPRAAVDVAGFEPIAAVDDAGCEPRAAAEQTQKEPMEPAISGWSSSSEESDDDLGPRAGGQDHDIDSVEERLFGGSNAEGSGSDGKADDRGVMPQAAAEPDPLVVGPATLVAAGALPAASLAHGKALSPAQLAGTPIADLQASTHAPLVGPPTRDLQALSQAPRDSPAERDPYMAQAGASMQSKLQASITAVQAALEACQKAGGDAMTEEHLQRRWRDLCRQLDVAGDADRIYLRARAMERSQVIETQRRAAAAAEKEQKRLTLQVKLKQAEADKAKAVSKEAAAAAKLALSQAQAEKDARKAQALSQAEEVQRLRLHFAAYLVRRLRLYMMEPGKKDMRRRRMQARAHQQRRLKAGPLAMPLVPFWPGTREGLVMASAKTRVKGKQEVLYASPDFLFELRRGGAAPTLVNTSVADPRFLFKCLVEWLMPEYFTVLGTRYGLDSLFAEAGGVLDLAFANASYRYTLACGHEYYRMGLCQWPPEPGWGDKDAQTAGFEPSSSSALVVRPA